MPSGELAGEGRELGRGHGLVGRWECFRLSLEMQL